MASMRKLKFLVIGVVSLLFGRTLQADHGSVNSGGHSGAGNEKMDCVCHDVDNPKHGVEMELEATGGVPTEGGDLKVISSPKIEHIDSLGISGGEGPTFSGRCPSTSTPTH